MSVAITTTEASTRLAASMTCPRCAQPMTLVNSATPLTREWRAVMRCPACRASQLLLVRLIEIADLTPEGDRKPQADCGTQAGYSRHRRNLEDQCDACLDAHAAAERDYIRRHGRNR